MNSVFLPDRAYPAAMAEIQARLAAVAETGTLLTPDGVRLAWVRYPLAGAGRVLVLVHGFTEFYRKYEEMIWFFRQMGYAVVSYDQRGHGLSQRLAEDPALVHVDRFGHYALDLDLVMRQLVLPMGLPVDLYSHSMGGAVSLEYLASHPGVIRRAVLSAPMLCPVTAGVPRPVVRLAARWEAARRGWRAKFSHLEDYNPNPAFETGTSTNRPRFDRHLALRAAEPRYQQGPATNRWIYESTGLVRPLLRQARQVELPVLLLLAEQDGVVRTDLQKKLARALPHCRALWLAGGRHTLYDADDPVRTAYYRAMEEFLAPG